MKWASSWERSSSFTVLNRSWVTDIFRVQNRWLTYKVSSKSDFGSILCVWININLDNAKDLVSQHVNGSPIPNTCQYCHFDRVSLMSKMDKPSYTPQGAHVRNWKSKTSLPNIYTLRIKSKYSSHKILCDIIPACISNFITSHFPPSSSLFLEPARPIQSLVPFQFCSLCLECS